MSKMSTKRTAVTKQTHCDAPELVAHTPLVRRLLELRAEEIAEGAVLLDWEGVWREVAACRGGVHRADSDADR